MTNEFININDQREFLPSSRLQAMTGGLYESDQTVRGSIITLFKAANSKMFFNRRATIRCVHESSTANFELTSTFEPGAPNRGLERSRQTRSIGCEIGRKAKIFTSGSQLMVRDKILSPDENPLGFIASEEDESSSEIILQTGTTGLGPIQIISFSEFEDRR